MNEIILDDGLTRQDLFPLTLTRAVADIRIGILTIREKWEHFFSGSIRVNEPVRPAAIAISANIIPTESLIVAIKENKQDQYISSHRHRAITYPWHIFQFNDDMIRSDFELITRGRKSEPLSPTNQTMGIENIFIEPGAKVEHCVLNATGGPIYIGKNAEVMEAATIRGSFALGEGAVVKMGARIYGATTVGPYSVVGGEIKNSVIFGYSNKAHDGYLGDSVIGEYCNLGAGSSVSNIKNTASGVKIWNEPAKKLLSAGPKCGLLMGDYSRSAINTSFNTGTVAGVCCNIFGHGLTPTYIPSFSWGYSPVSRYRFDDAIKDIGNWKRLKNRSVSDAEIARLEHIFQQS